MNRRSFFSLAALALGAGLARKVNALTGYAPITEPPKGSIFDLPPLDLGQLKPLTPEEKLQDSMLKGFYADAVRLPSHSHSIADPGHSHSVNPYWIPCEGQTVFINGVGVFEVVEDGRGLRRL